jgi:hypothetical protein
MEAKSESKIFYQQEGRPQGFSNVCFCSNNDRNGSQQNITIAKTN